MQNTALDMTAAKEVEHDVKSLKKFDASVKTIQDMLKKNGVKMSAIEIRELMKTSGLSADENKIKSYVRQLRQGF